MMYKSGFIACCKVDGKILREDAGIVTLPFGCEYSVLLKNLNSVRAQVKVSVDGTDATEGTWLIVPANGELELERYIRNGNFDKGNRFKFIERTAGIEAHKGIGASDGLIRVEYKSEVVQQVIDQTIIRKHYYDEWVLNPSPHYPPQNPWLRSGMIGNVSKTYGTSLLRGSGISGSSSRGGSIQAKASRGLKSSSSPGFERSMNNASMGDIGITVPGSESAQKFVAGPWFKTETTSHVIVLQLRGMLAGKAVKSAVTVKSKAKCETCGTANKSNMKFCGKCGTALTII